ncbi:MAG: hypothetical protein HZB67_03710 [Candidatus Aenigmarchaeota archaeon]|nr:hypothetical protein [Candidatus Aenigmarchaeota archaeon]
MNMKSPIALFAAVLVFGLFFAVLSVYNAISSGSFSFGLLFSILFLVVFLLIASDFEKISGEQKRPIEIFWGIAVLVVVVFLANRYQFITLPQPLDAIFQNPGALLFGSVLIAFAVIIIVSMYRNPPFAIYSRPIYWLGYAALERGVREGFMEKRLDGFRYNFRLKDSLLDYTISQIRTQTTGTTTSYNYYVLLTGKIPNATAGKGKIFLRSERFSTDSEDSKMAKVVERLNASRAVSLAPYYSSGNLLYSFVTTDIYKTLGSSLATLSAKPQVEGENQLDFEVFFASPFVFFRSGQDSIDKEKAGKIIDAFFEGAKIIEQQLAH